MKMYINILAINFWLASVTYGEISDSELAEQLFINLFKKRRVEQLEAVKSLRKLSNYEKQHSMIMLVAEKVFTVIQESRATIESSPYIPGVSDFPVDEQIQNALSNIIENTAFISEVILRFPDITQSVLKNNHNWDIILQWSTAFCNQVKYLLDKSTVKLLHLVSQELNHIERDPNYNNPYRKEEEKFRAAEKSSAVKRRTRKKIPKGPRLSNHYEL